MPRFRWSVALRLTAWYCAASILLLLAATGTLYWALTTNLERDSELFLEDKVHVVATMLRERPDDIDALREEVELEAAARRLQRFYIRILDDQGKTVMETPGMKSLLPPEWFAGPGGRARRMKTPQGAVLEAVTAYAPMGTPPRGYRNIQVAVDLSQQLQILGRYREWLWATLLAACLLCPLVGYEIARRGLKPVRHIAASAKLIGSSTLNERIRAEGYPAELTDLARTFNAMLDRLQEPFERLTRFSGDLAHELRTPVNNIRGEIEVALTRTRSASEYREVLESNLEEVVRLGELIGSLLFLARTENPSTHIDRQQVDVGDLLRTIREYFAGPAEETGVTIDVDAPIELRARLDKSLIQRAIGNLVKNALEHTQDGGSIHLGAASTATGLEIHVTDTGSGIPAESLSRVFDRFYRVDVARSGGGSGLGLSIVQGIMTLHGGSVQIASEWGKGTRVTLTSPR